MKLLCGTERGFVIGLSPVIPFVVRAREGGDDVMSRQGCDVITAGFPSTCRSACRGFSPPGVLPGCAASFRTIVRRFAPGSLRSREQRYLDVVPNNEHAGGTTRKKRVHGLHGNGAEILCSCTPPPPPQTFQRMQRYSLSEKEALKSFEGKRNNCEMCCRRCHGHGSSLLMALCVVICTFLIW